MMTKSFRDDFLLFTQLPSAILPILSEISFIPRIFSLPMSVYPALYTAFRSLPVPFSDPDYTPTSRRYCWYSLPYSGSLCYLIGQFGLGSFPSFLSPSSLVIRAGASLLADAGVLTAAAIASYRFLKTGITGIDLAVGMEYHATRVERTVLGSIGASGLLSVMNAIKNIALGLITFKSLDSEQQYFALKHHSLHSIGGTEKQCRAVVIDGMTSEWGWRSRFDDVSSPLVENLYRVCDVRAYRAGPDTVCEVVERGKKALGGPVDIVALSAHGDQQCMALGENYDLTGGMAQTNCLTEHLQTDGQIILGSCNTATGSGSLAEEISRNVPDAEVVGFAAFFNPYLISSSWVEKKLRLWSYYPTDNVGNSISLWNNTFRNFTLKA